MTYVRHSARHVHQTVFKHVEHHIDLLGWLDPLTTPFNSPAVTVQASMPEEYDEIRRLQPGRLAITMGPVPDAKPQEMGGGLLAVEYPFFFDCFQDTDAAAVALAEDVSDILHGYLPNTSTHLKVYDFTASTPVAISEWMIEIDDVVRTRAEGWKNWQIAKATATLYYVPDSVDHTPTGYPSATWG